MEMFEMQENVDLDENDEKTGPAVTTSSLVSSIIIPIQEPLEGQQHHDCRDNSNSFLLFPSSPLVHLTREEASINTTDSTDSMSLSSSIIMTNNCTNDTRGFETAIQSQLHRRKQQTNNNTQIQTKTIHSNPSPSKTNSYATADQPLIIFGIDLSYYTPNIQFFTCAAGVFLFTIIYGYLQELISVHVTGRRYTLFLSTCQFAGYTFWSILLTFLHPKDNATEQLQLDTEDKDIQREKVNSGKEGVWRSIVVVPTGSMSPQNSFSSHLSDTDTESLSLQSIEEDEEQPQYDTPSSSPTTTTPTTTMPTAMPSVPKTQTAKPWKLYIILSLLRAIDVGMTNGAMRFLNYPMKTLIKSSRAAFTMMGGMMIGNKRYLREDYWMVGLLVLGLGFFIHADMFSKDAVFHPIGLAMLVSVIGQCNMEGMLLCILEDSF
jgi:hypothetical protein